MTNNINAVSVVIVTYNRLDLLKKSIEKVLQQTDNRLKHLIVVNGASTDGTEDYLASLTDDRLIIENLDQNLGGAGGFNHGVKVFMQKTQDDAVWVMDDDSLATPTALQKLLAVFDQYPDAGLASSKVVWKDGNWSKMNTQAPADGGRYAVYYGKEPYVAIKHSTFVGTLFTRKAVQVVGLPQAEYFIWGDDIEYTERITRLYPGYFVRDSLVVHASKSNPLPGDIVGERNEGRLPRYILEYRNRLETSRRRRSIYKFIKTVGHGVLDFWRTMTVPNVLYRRQKLGIIIKGSWKGLFFRPKIEYLDDIK